MKRGVLWRLLIGCAVLAAVAGIFFFCTTAGAVLLARAAFSLTFDSDVISFRRAEGSLIRPLVFHDVEVKNLEGMPPLSVLRIQEMTVSNFFLQIENSRVGIRNARLKFPESDYPIVLAGSYENLAFNVNVYSKSLGVRDTLDLFAEGGEIRDVSGVIADVDSFLKGSWRKPELTGSFLVPRFSYKEFSLLDCPVSYNIRIEDIKEHPKPYGEVIFGEGMITSRHMTVRLEGGKMIFSGDPKKPGLDFQGNSDVEGVKIRIYLKGTMKKPDLRLTSDPPLSQEVLLVMLLTGKQWGASETVASGGNIPIDVARDFVDYFLFSGMGENLSKQLGLNGVSMTYNADSNALGVKKSFSDRVELRYDVERPPGTEQQQPTQTHKVGAEVKITDKISVEAEGQMRQEDTQSLQSQQAEEQQKDGKVVLKYKKKF